MNELVHIFERLGLAQYYENFVEEGFDTWDTVLYITESDLDALNVKLGHRRRLQREIAHARGISFDQLIVQSNIAASAQITANAERGRTGSSSQSEPQSTPQTSGPTKRKYRRHPKPDENAPERPSSAYVIFSNQIRDELKPLKLSFTEIAKTVGERWQNLNPEQKEPSESKANGAKDVFTREMAKYKKTTQYREYMQYLADFRTKNSGSAGGDGKRTRLDKEISRPSSGSAGSPIDGAFESSGLFRPPPLPTAPSGSSASSASPTSNLPPGGPPPPHPPPPPSVGPAAALPPRHHQQLPRIVPLEPTEAGHLPASKHSPPIESHPYSRPRAAARRTVGTPTASLIRNDTSKSSVSSNISGGSRAGSTGSSAFTPITPIDEGHYPHQRGGSFPRPPAPLSSLDRSHLPEHPPPPGAYGFSLPPIAQATAAPPGPYQPQPPLSHHYRSTSSPMKRLSLDDEQAGGPLGSGLSSGAGGGGPGLMGIGMPPSEVVASPRSAMSVASDRPERSPRSEDSTRDSSKLDPLSVLALAGNLMDRRAAPGGGGGIGGEERDERDPRGRDRGGAG